MSKALSAVRRAARPVVVLVAGLSALTASAIAYADGIDISHYQGTVSWSKVDDAGITFAFMKATEGTSYADPTLKTNWAGAERQGIYRSAYHFARPGSGSAVAQARFFVSKAGTFQDRGDLPPVLDLETTGGLGPAALRSWVSTWLSTVEDLTGRRPILYFSPYFWIDHLGNSTAFTKYPLWVAHYTTGSPKVPGGWSSWTFWQRTDSGRVSGIGGNVDMNRFNGTSAQLAALARSSGGTTAAPPAGPTVPTGAATTLTMAPGTAAPEAGQVVPFAGDLRTATTARAVPNRAVTLWTRPVGTSTWTLAKSASTDANGHYVLTAPVSGSADYQVRTVGDDAYGAAISPVSRLTIPSGTAVSLDLLKNRTTVTRGAPLMLYGHLTSGSAGVAGQTVRYYKRAPAGGSWIYVGRSTSKAPTGWHSIVVRPLVSRVWKVTYGGSDVLAPRTSGYLTVRPR